jgi:hypothetical protein
MCAACFGLCLGHPEACQYINVIREGRIMVGTPEGKRPLGRPRRRWEENIEMDLTEVGCGCMDWIGLVQARDRWRALVCAVMNLRVP